MSKLFSLEGKGAAIYILITFLFSSVFYYLIISNGHLDGAHGMYVLGLMWCPAAAAFLTSYIKKIKLSEMGWGIKPIKYLVLSYFLPLLYALAAYLIIWLTRAGGFYNYEFVERISARYGYPGLPAGMTILIYVIISGTLGMAGSVLSAMGEEIGWRGFLIPQLAKKYSFTVVSLISGIVWSIWHYPILLFADYNSGAPAWYSLTCFTILVLSISFVFTWIRLKSGSFWTGVILHASHNLFIQAVFTPLTYDTGITKYFIDEFGIVLPLVSVLLAFYFWKKRKELPFIPAG